MNEKRELTIRIEGQTASGKTIIANRIMNALKEMPDIEVKISQRSIDLHSETYDLEWSFKK